MLVVVLAVGVSVGLAARFWMDGLQAQQSTDRPAAGPVTATPVPTLASASASGDVVVEVSEGDVQSQLSTMLIGRSLGATPLGDATIQSVTVAFRDRQVHVGGAARAGLLQAPFAAAGTVAPNAAGRPMVNVSDATVGGVKLPDAARLALTDTLQSQVDSLFADRAMRVRTIDIMDGKMRVVGTAAGS